MDPYPWLDLDDPRRGMSDEEILDKYIGLSSSDLNTEEKSTLVMCGYTPLTIRETETLTSNGLYI